MKKISLLMILGFILSVGVSCSDDKPDGKSIFVDSEENWNEFDEWLEINFRLPYNIRFIYKMEDYQSNMDYNLIPAQYEKSIQMAKLFRHLFLDVYNELTGNTDFLRTYVPKLLHLIGSPAYNTSNGTIVLGTAEGGLKITLYNINALEPTNITSLNSSYFNTIHHEFFHILHQTLDIPQEFKTISPEYYLGSSWNNGTDALAASQGFVSKYARSNYYEDFVETMSRYVTRSDSEWATWLAQATDGGAETINRKLNIAREYMLGTWEMDLDKLRDIVQRRQGELVEIDFDNL